MKLRAAIFVFVIIGTWLCTASLQAGSEVKHSGFLEDYSQLKPGPEGGVAMVYVKEGVDFKKYNQVMLDEAIFYLKAGENQGISVDEMKELSDKFHRAVIDALGGTYPLVGEPGPEVMRVRVAITDLQLPKRALSAISTVTPAGLGLNIIKKGITGKSTGVGEISMEFELLDSQANERIAAGADRRAGGKIEAMTKFGTAEDAFKFWANRLRARLDEFHGKQH